MTQILIIARDTTTGPTFKNILGQFGAAGIVASEPQDILHILRTIPVNGILMNMPTYLRMQGEGKGLLNEILSCYPLLRCRIDAETSALTVFEQGSEPPEQHIAKFIEQCKATQPRTIRREERTAITCCILLSQDSTFGPSVTERTITINTTEHGIFCFSTHRWKPGASAWIQFLDLTDKTPISGTIIHSSRWGKGCRIPGCGINFAIITDQQRFELKELLNRTPRIIGDSSPIG